MKKRLLSILLCLVMVVGLLPVSALAAVVRDDNGNISYEPTQQGIHSNGGYTIDKVSHPTLGAGEVDAILSGKDQDRSNSYSWSMADGGKNSDYIYIGTCANATWHQYHLNVQTTLNGMVKKGDLPAGTDTKEMAAEIVRSVFGVGTFDETYSSGWDPVIIAVNKTTFKAEVVFRESDIRKDYPNIFVGYPTTDPGFNVLAGYRMVCRFNDKLYFVSMGQPTATLVEVDPYTNEAQIAYYNTRFNRVVASGVHGLIVYDGEILMCLATDNYDGNKTPGGIIVASSDPSADLSKWRVIADQDDFDNLPAVMNTDGLNGGGIWDIIEYNGHLYVTVVTDKNIDGKINKQGFAMYRGDKDSNGNFTWKQIIGKKDGSKYGYGLGIDHSMSCNLWVYNGYLYMGTYNDPMLDLAEVPATGNFELLYNDLDHSIYLYRMDANENFEQVAGKNDNPYFPNGSIGNLGTGLGNNSNQYVWRMGEHNGEFYIGTYDTATITYKFTQITDGQLRDMKYDDIRGRADELQKALERALGEYGDNVLFQWFLRKTVFSDYTLQLIQKLAGFATDMSADKNPVPDYRQMLSDYEAFKAKVYGILDKLSLTDAIKFTAENPKATAQLLAEDVSVASISTMSREDKFNFVNTMKERIKAMLDEIFKVYDTVVYDETIHNFVYYFGCNYYSQKSEPGFDLLVSNDGVNFDVITSDGFGDAANHGLRCITSTEQGVFLGTANPYYATQLWLMHSDADKPAEVVPEAPVATEIPTAYIVSCVTENSGHGADTMDLIADTFTIGEVTKDGDNYVCPITIATAKYAEAYSVENGKHTAKEASITFNMTWDGQEWKAPEMTQLPVIEVECKATKPEAPKAPAETALPSAYLVSCTTNDAHADAWMLAIPGADTIGEVTKDGETYICPITVSTKEYAEEYSAATVINKPHTALEETVTYNMTWDGQKWKAPAMTQLPVIELKCEATKPDPKPDPETFTVTVVGSEAAITGAGKYEAGKLVTIDAGMRLGYTFAGWTANSDVSLGNWYSSSTTFTMPKYDVTLTANWRLTPIDPTPSIPSVSNLYPIEILDTTNGAVTSSHKYASAGTTVTLTVNPAAGYTLGSLTAYTSNKVDLKLTDKGEGKYTFTMPASKVFVASVFNPVNGRFVDVPSGSYFEEAVNWAVANGITTGTSATTFDPDGICTRAQAVTFLWRAAGSPAPANSATPFTDVAADSYYAQAVAWAVENGITKGTSDTTFSPDAHCSRAQIVTFLWRAQKSPVVTAANPFADVSVDAYYVNAIQWAVSEGVTTGTSAVTFSPDADCTRAQIVTFIWRALGK